MRNHTCPQARSPHDYRHAQSRDPRRSFWRSWFLANSLLSGVFALCWLILRSGTKPSRFAYPCQQAAFSTVSLAFGVPLVATLVAARRRIVAGLRTPVGMTLVGLGLLMTAGEVT